MSYVKDILTLASLVDLHMEREGEGFLSNVWRLRLPGSGILYRLFGSWRHVWELSRNYEQGSVPSFIRIGEQFGITRLLGPR